MITTLQKPKCLRLKSAAELRAILRGDDTITIDVAEELAAHAIEAELEERYDDPYGITDADIRDSKADEDDSDEDEDTEEPKVFEGKRLKIYHPDDKA